VQGDIAALDAAVAANYPVPAPAAASNPPAAKAA
jgi:hypothetical protein